MNKRLTQPFAEPVSTYDLLTRIKEIFLEDYLRCRMSGFLWRREEGEDRPGAPRWPRCGTVGCISGWAGFLLGLDDRADFDRLGLNFKHRELFFPTTEASGFTYEEEGQQTRAFAQKVATHIEKFQAEHEQLLRKHMCVPARSTTR